MLYLDHAATTATHPDVIDEMMPFFGELYANPSSSYEFGTDAKLMLEKARIRISDSIHCEPEEIFFTSGGTEADNWALVGAAEGCRKKGKHIITSCIEHHAVLRSCEYLASRGYEITYLPVDSEGFVHAGQLEQAIRPDTILISIMYANNEIGTIQPVDQLAEIARRHGILFHTDAVQAYMHQKIDVRELSVDMLSASAHKFYGPKGVGFLYVRKGSGIAPFLHGGGQERKQRAGTENVAGIVGMGKAVSLAEKNREATQKRILEMRNYLIEAIQRDIPYSRINGSIQQRLAGNVNVSFRFLEGESLIILLDMEGIYVSAGSACSSGEKTISHVLQSIGLPEEWARGTIRITLGEENTMEEIRFFVRRLGQLVSQLREFSDEYLYNKN